MDSVWKQIGAIAEENSGIITTAQVEAAGISRTALKRYVDEKQLIRVCKGLYVLEKGWWMNMRCCKPGAEKPCILMGQRFSCGACQTECRTHLI